MSRTETTHPSLLLRVRDHGDHESWQTFHARYGHLLYRYARSRGATHDDAQDVAQEVLLQFVRTVERFEYDAAKGRFRAYLRAAVVHEMARHARRRDRQPPGLDPRCFDFVAAERKADDDEDWQAEWRLGRLRWTVQDIAAEFDATTLKAFEMHVLAGCAVAETADKLGISKWRVYRARRRVLRRLAGALNGAGEERGEHEP